jgi:hypothetical protein
MRRRDFVAGGVGAVTLAPPVFGQGLDEWKSPFIDQWVKGAWLATFSDASIKPVQMEFYSYSASTEERGSFVLRAAAGQPSETPSAVKKAYARPTKTGAEVGYLTADGNVQYRMTFTASDTQEGTCRELATGKASVAKLRRLSTIEIDAQRSAVLKGEKPTFINTSYFG